MVTMLSITSQIPRKLWLMAWRYYCVLVNMNPMASVASGCLALAELGRRGLLLPDRLKGGIRVYSNVKLQTG